MELQKTDDIFSLWDVNRKDIELFIEQANTFHPTIKFHPTMSHFIPLRSHILRYGSVQG